MKITLALLTGLAVSAAAYTIEVHTTIKPMQRCYKLGPGDSFRYQIERATETVKPDPLIVPANVSARACVAVLEIE